MFETYIDKISELSNDAAMRSWGEKFAQELKIGMVVSLIGELGAGKTTLVKGIVQGLGGVVEEVTSPTFTIVNSYDSTRIPVLHCDFYRFERGDELEDLGGLEFFYQENLFLIEWANRVNEIKLIEENRIVRVEIQHIPNGRSIHVCVKID